MKFGFSSITVLNISIVSILILQIFIDSSPLLFRRVLYYVIQDLNLGGDMIYLIQDLNLGGDMNL